MNKVYAKHYVLDEVARRYGWGWFATNWLPKNSKGYLLQFRKQGILEYAFAKNDEVSKFFNYELSGSDLIAMFYKFTTKGFLELIKAFPEKKYHKMTKDLLANGE